MKDLGAKCFGFTKMDSAEIPQLKAELAKNPRKRCMMRFLLVESRIFSP